MNMAVQAKKTKAEQGYSDQFKAVLETLPGDASVTEVRKQAIARFKDIGLPNRRVEEWKYTDLRAAIQEAYSPAQHDTADLTDAELKAAYGSFADLDCYRVVFVNGRYRADKFGYGDGIDVQSINDLLTEKPSWVVEQLQKGIVFPENDASLALNSAFMADGVAVQVSGKIDKPVHIVFINRGNEAASVNTRNLISVADGANATVVEQFVTLGETAFQTNTVTETVLGKDAELNHIKVQTESAVGSHLSTWTVTIGEKARYSPFQLTSGAGLSRDQLHARFDGEYASINFGSIFLGRDKQHADTTLVVDHAVPHCESREHYKGVMADKARGVFQGKLMVKKIAQKTDGKQMAQALLLSEDAEFDAKPELEIFADDVVCGHGATSGQIDEDLLFYLRARGIPEDQAKALLIQAFTGETLELIENEDIRECLSAIVVDWLGTAKSEV